MYDQKVALNKLTYFDSVNGHLVLKDDIFITFLTDLSPTQPKVIVHSSTH